MNALRLSGFRNTDSGLKMRVPGFGIRESGFEMRVNLVERPIRHVRRALPLLAGGKLSLEVLDRQPQSRRDRLCLEDPRGLRVALGLAALALL